MQSLPDVAGKIDYITSPDRQEYLYSVYRTCDDGFWKKLAEENQRDFKRSGSAGKCIEARALIIALPEEYQYLKPDEVLKKFTDYFKEKYGVSPLQYRKRYSEE